MAGIFKKSVSDLYIARPAEHAGDLIWRYPDQSIPNGAKLTVRSDEEVIFFREGRVIGQLQAGPYTLETANIPFLGDLVVGPLTGDNHFITELFFVRKAEFLHSITNKILGTYVDLNSRNLINIVYTTRFGIKISDSVALITNLGGMQAASEDQVLSFLDARLKSILSACVGEMVSKHPVLFVVSNQYSEEIGNAVQLRAAGNFVPQGLTLTRFLELNLSLTEESEELLREFGKAQASLNIQREGTEIASNPGFANYHIAQGQRSAMEGLGQGLSAGTGTGPILGLGLGLNMGISGHPIYSPPSIKPEASFAGKPVLAPTPQPGSVDNALTMKWYLESSGGSEGPYNVRHLVLRALAEGLTADTARVRGEGDPEWFPAAQEEVLLKEFRKRQRVAHQENRNKRQEINDVDTFEKLFALSVVDDVLKEKELLMLIPIAIKAGMAATEEGAAELIKIRAKAVGCVLENNRTPTQVDQSSNQNVCPPPPPPPPKINIQYSYNDGKETLHNLSPEVIAEKIMDDPNGYHIVWKQGMVGWVNANDIDDIAKLLRQKKV